MKKKFLLLAFLVLQAPAYAQSLPIPDSSLLKNQEPPTAVPKTEGSQLLQQQNDGPIESSSTAKKLTLKEVAKERRNQSSVLSEQDFQNLELTLEQQGAQAVIEALKKIPPDNTILAWMESKAYQGHVLMMWYLADHLSILEPLKSIYWAQAALLGTRQEAAICVNSIAVQNAPLTLTTQFNRASRASAANAWHIKDGINFALKLYQSLPKMPDPTLWLCKPYTMQWAEKSGLLKNSKTKTGKNAPKLEQYFQQKIYTYDPQYWDALRKKERNRYRLELSLTPLEP